MSLKVSLDTYGGKEIIGIAKIQWLNKWVKIRQDNCVGKGQMRYMMQ